MSESDDCNGLAEQCPMLPEWPEHLRDGRKIVNITEGLQVRLNDIHADTKHLETIAQATREMVKEVRALRSDGRSGLLTYGVLVITFAVAAALVNGTLSGTPKHAWKIPNVAEFSSEGQK
jgi:hypothetical protein